MVVTDEARSSGSGSGNAVAENNWRWCAGMLALALDMASRQLMRTMETNYRNWPLVAAV